jgi:hypothetical protein
MHRILVAFIICTAFVPPSAQRRAPDCYALTLGTWNRPVERWQHVPAVIQLDTVREVRDHGDSRGPMVMRPSIYEGPRPRATWTKISADSIELSWSNGFVSEHVRAGIGADSLSGIIEAFSDFTESGEITRSAKVTGIRTICPEKLD